MSMTVSLQESREVERFEREHPRSREASERSRRVMPDGVAQVMRAMQPFPITIARAAGAPLRDSR